MKDRMKEFIHKLFWEYECEPGEFWDHWKILSVPSCIIFQILFFLYEYFFETPENKLSVVNALLEGLWWAFGGLAIYVLFTLAMGFIAAIINKKSYKVIMLVLGIIGTFFAYHRLH